MLKNLFLTLVLSSAEEVYVNVSSQPHVVGQVPAHVVRVFVDHHAVAVPQPAVTIAVIIGSHRKVESVEPEAIPGAARQYPDVAAAESAVEVPMLPGMIKVVMDVEPARVMTHPVIAWMNMGRVRMAIVIHEMAILHYLVVLPVVFARAMRRNVFVMVTIVVMIMILGQTVDRN